MTVSESQLHDPLLNTMSPTRAMFPRTLAIFNEQSLKTDEALRSAVSELEGAISPTNIDHLLNLVLKQHGLLAFLISATSETSPFSKEIIEQFPTSADAFTSSLASKILQNILIFLHFLDHDFEPGVTESLRQCRSSVGLASRVLQAIASLWFDATGEGVIAEKEEEEEEEEISFFKVKKRSQRHQRRVLSTKPFQDLGEDVPQTLADAVDLATRILQDQKRVLEYYFIILRLPELSGAIKKVFITEHDRTDAGNSTAQGSDDVDCSASEPLESGKPGAYPIVQPMKAALYFESADGFGEWRILISNRADRNLREARRTDAQKFKIIIKKIKELSRGQFSDDNHKRLNGASTDIPIYEAKMTRDLRLVYQVDCVPEYDSTIERQVIKIYGIYTHAQLDRRLWDSMGYQLGSKGKEYKRRCTFRNRPYHAGDNVIMPATFPPEEPISPDLSRGPLNLPREDLDELHSLLVLEKFVTLSQALLNSIIADQDVAHVFAVSSQEKEIIEHQYSCYVLGRSGTGKTTTMLFKMLGIERAWALLDDGGPKPRQLFVTQSRVLAEKVEEYFSKLFESLVTASQSLQDLAKAAKAKKSQDKDTMLLDRDDEANWREDLPQRFSLLKDEHFPLFITFDRLCKLLEADICHASQTRILENETNQSPGDDSGSVHRRYMSSSSGPSQETSALVSYNAFFEFYWSHFPQSLIKGLDPSLVYSEVMGVIKGSEQTLGYPECFLDKVAYEELSHRAQSTFATQRDTIYSIFQSYLRRKRERCEYDAADRTHAIIRYMQERGMLGQRIDYLYVDEAQDNLLIDALLLRSLCRNADGLFWAGDTAQTISVGSSFRFNDLKAFLFRIEEKNALSLPGSMQPRSFQLAVNYRSHGGIVNCAHSVIELITEFWPYAIDILAQEKGVVDGLRPVFLGGWDQDSVRYEQFLFGESGSHIEFGAQQCILVRDNAARERLRAQVGEIGLILTLYESKGLEFNDVLLYNFFQDSTVDLSQWRVILNAIDKSKRKSVSAPRFDETRHAGVCSELKFLYVAITRARKNMWIVDCSEKSEPMRVFWTNRELIQNCTPGTDVPHLAVSSTPEEWEKSGTSLFQNKRYLQAKHCFERASLFREAAVAHAYYLREQARVTPLGPRQSDAVRANNFVQAADAFSSCAEEANKEKYAYFRIAAECYVRSGDDFKAAKAYINGKDFNLGAQLYRKKALFEDAVDVIRNYRMHMDPEVVTRILNVVRIVYFNRHHDNPEYLKKAASLFSSYEEALEFTEVYDLDVAQAALLEYMGRIADAAELHLSEGRTSVAIKLFLKDFQNERSMLRANQCLLDGLWQNLSFGIDAANANPVVEELLRLTAQLNFALLEPCDTDEVSIFREIMANNRSKLEDLGQTFHRVHKKKYAALLCLDHIFVNAPRIQVASSQEVSSQLHIFYMYALLLQEIAFTPDPCNDASIRKLFGFEPSTDHVFFVRAGTFLHPFIIQYRTPFVRESEDGIWISDRALSWVFRRALCERLRHRVLEENKICHRTQAFSPCLTYAVLGVCNRGGCPEEHIKAEAINGAWYNARVRLHLQQVLIFHTLHSIDIGQDRVREHQYWLNQLHEALNPPFYRLGTPANLAIDLIPEARNALKIVKDWVHNLIYTIRLSNFTERVLFLTTISKAATLCFTFDRAEGSHYIFRAPCVMKSPDITFLRKDDEYIVEELLHSLEGTKDWSVSAGILSIRHIIENQLTINVSVLCDIVDQICGFLILSVRYYRMSILHDVTLPRSWLLSLSTQFEEGAPKHSNLLMMFSECVATLLMQIYQAGPQSSYLLYGQLDLSKLPVMIRNIFIARVCRSLCLLGYNIYEFRLRNHITQTMKALGNADRRGIYGRYASAKDWYDLAIVVRQSTMGSSMDQMIHVHHESRVHGPLRTLKGTRNIIIKNLADIPHALETEVSSIPSTRLRADAVPFVSAKVTALLAHQPLVPKSQGVSEDVDEPQEDEPDQEGGEVEGGHETEELTFDHKEVTSHSADMIRSREIVVPPSEEETQAAYIIQTAYRRYVSRRRGAATTSLSVGRAILFIDCWKEAQKMVWPRRYYRQLFLGPIPHILLCLQEIQARIYSSKERSKKRTKKAVHQELEDLMTHITEVNVLLKIAKRLQQALEPRSDFHRRRNIEELKSYVCEVETLFHRCERSLGKMDDLWGDLAIGLKGIVVKRQVSKKEKPQLNVED